MKRVLVFIVFLSIGIKCFAETAQIEKAIMMKDYSQAVYLANRYLNDSPKEKDKILFLLGEAYIGSGSLVDARETFRDIYKKFPDSVYAEKAVLKIADSYYLESNYLQAKKVYLYFLKNYPATKFSSYAYLNLAYCDEKLGDWDSKKKDMRILKDKYSSSIEASKLEELERRGYSFVIQVGAFLDKKNAQELFRQLKKKGFDSYVVEDKENGSRFYKVRVGKFDGRSDAEVKREALLDKGFPARIFP